MKYPLKLEPAIKDYLWGSESWVVSTHPDGLSTVAGGGYAGQTLKAATGELPVLIKIIETREPLSLQVHPNDEYARRVEKDTGKSEMWYVTGAEPGAGVVLGLNNEAAGSGDFGREELRQLIETGGIMTAVQHVKVKAGDSFCIPAGLLHSIGKGVTLIEVQQPSNLTYRVYDYGRVDSTGRSRELQIEKALDVIDASLEAERTGAAARTAGGSVLADWEYFKSELVTVDGSKGMTARQGFECLVAADGKEGRFPGLTLKYSEGEITLQKGEAVFIPHGTGDYMLESEGGSASVVRVWMPGT